MFRVVLLVAAAVAMAASGKPIAQQVDSDSFESKLARAERLNVTAPWRESQAILDELRSGLPLAGDSQFARFKLLEARNLALDGELERSLEVLESLMGRDMPDDLRLRVHSRAANIAYIARRFETTFSNLNAALRMLEDPELRKTGDVVYSLASYTYALVDELERAREFGALSLEIARERDDPRAVCTTAQNLGFVYKQAGDSQRSRELYEMALSACEAAGDDLIAAVTRYGLADLLRRLGGNADAERLFDEALSGLETADYKPGMAEARLYYARLEISRGALDRVGALLDGAMEQLRRDRNWEYLAEAYRLLAEVEERRGAPAAALSHYRKHMEARGMHQQLVRARQTAFLEVQFEVRHTEQQLALLQEQERLRDIEAISRAQQRRLRTGIYILIGLLVAVLLVLLVRATRERRRFQGLSRRDALTALSNHTRFFELAERTLSLTREKRIGFTLVLADIDHFKRVNDRHGHLVGDEVLRRVAGRLREHFAKKGIIGRIGGEEFGIALPGVSHEELNERLEAFRASLANMRWGDASVHVTMSFGIARPRDSESLVEIRERADRALYQAKRAGRDRVVDVDRID
ncbi:MAG: diguanylate cyclase [Candidatus Wenzhouxiangella sp. M2_3B_020]